MSYRDPWSNYSLQHPSLHIRRLNERWERNCLSYSDKAIIYGGWFPDGIEFFKKTFGWEITNKVYETPLYGCDEKFIDKITGMGNKKTDDLPINFVHLGTLHGGDHSAKYFLRGIEEYLKRPHAKKVIVNFVGNLDRESKTFLKNTPELNQCIYEWGFISHAEAISIANESDFALWFQASENNYVGNINAKIFEYFYLGLYVIAFTPVDESNSLLLRHKRGINVFHSDTKGIVTAISDCVNCKEKLRFKYGETPYPRKTFIKWFENFWAY